MANNFNNNFSSKYNIGQSIAEGIYNDITIAFNYLERGSFDKAFTKFKTIKGKIPISKIKEVGRKNFKFLDSEYSKAHNNKDKKMMYRIIIKYSEVLIGQLDKNSMYLPSLRDTTHFT